MPEDHARQQLKGEGFAWGLLDIARGVGNWLFFYPTSKNSYGIFPAAGGAFYFPEEEKAPVEPASLIENLPASESASLKE
jgi:hypothetical protein